MTKFSVASSHKRASRLKAKGNLQPYLEKYKKTFSLFHSMLVQGIVGTESLNVSFNEGSKLQIENEVYGEIRHV